MKTTGNELGMEERHLNKLVRKIDFAHSKYVSACGDLEMVFQEVSDFELLIDYYAGDGLMVLDVELANLAPIKHAINELKKTGTYNRDQHERGCM